MARARQPDRAPGRQADGGGSTQHPATVQGRDHASLETPARLGWGADQCNARVGRIPESGHDDRRLHCLLQACSRRLGALLYDSLLLLAVLMLGTACFLPFTGGKAITFDEFPVLAVLHRLAVAVLTIGFYGIFWTRRGQTLGMASWRLTCRTRRRRLIELARHRASHRRRCAVAVAPGAGLALDHRGSRPARLARPVVCHTRRRCPEITTRAVALARTPEQHSRQGRKQHGRHPAHDPGRQIK